MQSLPANIYSVAAVRQIDRIAIDEFGVPGYTLMKRAGVAAVRAARHYYPDSGRWQVVCGSGNNAGDGFVVARLAAQEGIVVSVVSLVSTETLRGDAVKACEDFIAEGGAVVPWSGELDAQADLLVDAILGSGLERDLSGDFAAAVRALNAHRAPIHAMDIATGINGDSGQIMGLAVKAALTTTFVGLKPGLFLADGPEHSGVVTFDDLEIDPDCRSAVEPAYRRIDDTLLIDSLPKRARDAHKGDFGHVLVVGGGPGMSGAARMCAEAALRCGAGRVSVATHPDHAAMMAAALPEIMYHAITTPEQLKDRLEQVDVIAFGPGLGRSEWAKGLYAAVEASSKIAIWDADALNLLESAPKSAENRIITPHPGEAATLLQSSAVAVQKDRSRACRALQRRYGGIAVLKGAGTLISDGGRLLSICTSGNPGMAAAGMGDVLTGVIAAVAAQGVPLRDAALVGVEIHARAGDVAATFGERGMLASDVIAAIRKIVNP